MKTTKRFLKSKRLLWRLQLAKWVHEGRYQIWFDEAGFFPSDVLDRYSDALDRYSGPRCVMTIYKPEETAVAIDAPSLTDLPLLVDSREMDLEEVRRLFPRPHPRQVLMLASPKTFRLWGGRR